MKLLYAFLLVIPFALAGCQSMPAPKNANGTINPSVAVAEGALGYARAANEATGYISTCHANMATIGCSEAKVTQVKAAIVKADAATKAAIAAVKANPNAGAGTLDGYIADLNVALALLQALVQPNGGN